MKPEVIEHHKSLSAYKFALGWEKSNDNMAGELKESIGGEINAFQININNNQWKPREKEEFMNETHKLYTVKNLNHYAEDLIIHTHL